MSFWNEKFETMNRDEMRAFQGEKLTETVKWLYERIDFYRSTMDDMGLYAESDETSVATETQTTVTAPACRSTAARARA